MTFISWDNTRKRVIQKKISRAKSLINSINPDFKLLHPEEFRDGNQGNFIKMTNRIIKETKLRQQQIIDRRAKLV